MFSILKHTLIANLLSGVLVAEVVFNPIPQIYESILDDLQAEVSEMSIQLPTTLPLKQVITFCNIPAPLTGKKYTTVEHRVYTVQFFFTCSSVGIQGISYNQQMLFWGVYLVDQSSILFSHSRIIPLSPIKKDVNL